MARIGSPSVVMYAKLKEYGISNRDAASTLLNTSLTFDGRTLKDRIDESSQLSRRIVHTNPGEIPIGLFNSFTISCPQVLRVVLRKLSTTRYGGDEEQARRALIEDLTGDASTRMTQGLQACNVDESLYHNMSTYIKHADLPHEDDRALLHLMLFVIIGCTGNPQTASIMVVDYATNVLGADFHTAQTVINTASAPSNVPADVLLGLVRVIEGHIKSGSKMHVMSPEGTEIGLLPNARHIVSDVDEDVSRSHALVWRENGRWYIQDLHSTNGTTVISGATGNEIPVEPEPNAPVEIAATDIICLGATTRFIVMPVMGA